MISWYVVMEPTRWGIGNSISRRSRSQRLCDVENLDSWKSVTVGEDGTFDLHVSQASAGYSRRLQK